MQLHTLQPTYGARRKKRIARGGKRGTYSGRGLKGQKSRAGHRIRPAERDLLIRIPKLRGFGNKPIREKAAVFPVTVLDKMAESVISPETFRKYKMIGKRDGRPVKLLSGGVLKKAATVKGILLSRVAREAIEKAGGSIR